MDILLGIQVTAGLKQQQSLEKSSSSNRSVPPPPKVLEALEQRTQQGRNAKQQMQQIFAQALADLDETFDSNIKKLTETQALTQPTGDLPVTDLLVSYDTYLNQFDDAVRRLDVRYSRTLYIPPIHKSYADPIYDQKNSQGDEVRDKFRQIYESFPEPPTSMQKRFLEASMASMVALLYGDEYTNDPEYVLEHNRWTETNGVLALLTGRKTGKSTVCAMLAIDVLMCIAGSVVVVTSRTLKQAQIIVNTVRLLIRRHPLFKLWGYRVASVKATFMAIEGPDGSERTIEGKKFTLIIFLFFLSLCFFAGYHEQRYATNITKEVIIL